MYDTLTIKSVPTRVRVLLALSIAALVAVAWSLRWIQDDAFITFVYSRHLLRGLGPVWNRGYAVEGYTNFLWMLLIAGGMFLGMTAELASYVFGLASFVVSLLLVFQLARRVLGDSRWALISTLLVGTNYSFLMYATGGLETQLDAAFTLSILCITLRVRQEGKVSSYQLVLFSLLAALGILTRMDSVIPCGVATLLMLQTYVRSLARERPPHWQRTALLDAASLVLPAGVLLGSWLTWKYHLYGEFLPNTFRVKVRSHGIAVVLRGIAYVGWLLVSYWWLPLAVVIAVRAKQRLSGLLAQVAPLLLFAAVWAAYVIWVGGDIMEFRLLIPVIPMLIIALVAALTRLEPRYAALAVGVMLLGSVSHAVAFPYYVRPAGICNIPSLQGSARLFRAIGVHVGDDLNQDPDVSIAVMPAGFIPYFSNARSIDMLGLNDRWVARNGFVRSCKVCLGHARLATFAYLNSANVNLVIAGPQYYTTAKCMRKHDVAKAMMFGEELDYENIPSSARIISIPIGIPESPHIAALYFRANAAIDAAIAKGVWSEIPEC